MFGRIFSPTLPSTPRTPPGGPTVHLSSGDTAPGDLIRSHRLGAVPQDSPPSPRPKVPAVPCASEGPMMSLLGFNFFVSGAHGTQRNLLRLDYWFIIKRYDSGTASWRRRRGQGMWEGAWRIQVLSECTTLPNLQLGYTPTGKLSKLCHFAFFYRGFIT